MKDFTSVWKFLASDKNATNAETFQYCLLRAMAAKHEDKHMIALYFIQRAYTPITNTNKLTNGMHKYLGVIQAAWNSNKRSESPLLACLETPEEETLFSKLRDSIVRELCESASKYYTFIFVRSDLEPEYQLVQSNHAALALGWMMASQRVTLPVSGESVPKVEVDGIDIQQLYLAVCHVKNEEELLAIKLDIQNHGYQVVTFNEPDIEDQATAIASFPIAGNKKHFLKCHKAFKFEFKMAIEKDVFVGLMNDAIGTVNDVFTADMHNRFEGISK
jgi:hypothetical protein